jgi:1,4-dihydroxy-2-naphthoate octaprenyltransferase
MLKTETGTNSIKLHLWTLPRWFAAPFPAMAAVIGALLAGGVTLNSWLGVIAALLIMAGGHSFNSFLDYAWTGLDKGVTEERSAEKDYTGAQSLLAKGALSLRQVLINALIWYVLALAPLIYLALQVSWVVLLLGVLGMLITFWYSQAKFNWTHELSLGIGLGPLPALIGMFATSPQPPWIQGILAGVPFGLALSFAGLAMDEWPDAEANLKKGVKSIAYKVWEHGLALEWYLSSWLLFIFLYQVLMIVVGVYKPLTGISFLTFPFFIAFFVLMKRNFNRAANAALITLIVYFLLLTLGQILG